MTNNSIKWIISDLDGTLFYHDDKTNLQYDKQTVITINQAIDSNIRFSVATGRHYKDALLLTENIINYPSNSFIVGLNGSQIYSLSEKKLILNKSIDDSKKNELISLQEKIINKYGDNLLFFIYCEDDNIFFIKNQSKDYEKLKAFVLGQEQNQTIFSYGDLNSINECSKILKICILFINGVEKYHDEVLTFLHDSNDSFDYVISADCYLEILSKNTSKGNAIEYINKNYYQNLSKDEIIIFGDSGNDISMFMLSNFSVTRDNAKDYIKSSVKYVYHGGPSSFIKHAINDLIFSSFLKK